MWWSWAWVMGVGSSNENGDMMELRFWHLAGEGWRWICRERWAGGSGMA